MHVYQVLLSVYTLGAIKYRTYCILDREKQVLYIQQCSNNDLQFYILVKPCGLTRWCSEPKNCKVQMFYFRFVVDPDVLVWVHAIDLHLEVPEVSSHLGRRLVHIGWVDFKTFKKLYNQASLLIFVSLL